MQDPEGGKGALEAVEQRIQPLEATELQSQSAFNNQSEVLKSREADAVQQSARLCAAPEEVLQLRAQNLEIQAAAEVCTLSCVPSLPCNNDAIPIGAAHL